VIDEERTQLARWHSRFPWRYSVLLNLYWSFRDDRLDWESYRLREAYMKGSSRHGPYVVTGPPREFATPEDLYEELTSIWETSSLVLSRLCQSQGIRYFHFLQPNQYVTNSKPMGDDERRTAIRQDHPYRRGVELGYPLMIRKGEELRRQHVSFHDLTRIFQGHAEAIYVDFCCHYNQEGYDLLADAVARAMTQEMRSE
jgi:hypothetical protein